MAADWLNDFTKVLDSATGVVQAAANVVNPPKMTTAASSTPPQGETTPKQALEANNEAKASAIPWALIIGGGLILLAVVEW